MEATSERFGARMKLAPTWNNRAYDYVMAHLHGEGFVAYAVGGCVRDALLGHSPNDVDVATNARPHDLPKIFQTKPWDGDSDTRENADGVALYPTGVSHGTWTVRVGDDHVEVTTFRKDVATDGRRATVAFADTLEEDAQRRDFTMNALYLDKDHNVIDPTGTGQYDLFQGQVKFIGNANERIKEDYLRIMRLFRFHARFGRGSMNREAWESAKRHCGGISQHVSGERIWAELKKILSMHAPSEALWEMAATGVLSEVLGVQKVPLEFSRVLENERLHKLCPRWSTRYVALTLRSDIPFPASNAEKKAVESALEACESGGPILSALAHTYGAEAATTACLYNGWPYVASEINRGAMAELPLKAADLMEAGVKPGPRLGEMLDYALSYWYGTDLRATRETLLKHVLSES